MIERKSMLLTLALAALILVSVPGVIFNDAVKKYFNFMGGWNTATIKPSRTNYLPPTRPRHERPDAPARPELRFVTFSVKIAGAAEVKIAGDFNKWNPESLPLAKKPGNRWEAIIPLPPGKYKYLCRVDGREVLDPLNPDTDTETGRKVSLLTVK
ncbi:MAG: hypothetical protein A2234_00300 [Elusimicrobia bacterium RIFOXYA2_FULL_58_8]|nr:MAG: hypothetical protein A2285_00940 [Elusimicrobia bacterium RIFOXYA12_FULL_57_11]OGS13248.1 MAG: hypothetical protein A2234_00300 [Elusimicrobia bacterium RIFOXYA2_FULL_58_8]